MKDFIKDIFKDVVKDRINLLIGFLFASLLPLSAVYAGLVNLFSIKGWFWIAIVSSSLVITLLSYMFYNRPKYTIDPKSNCYIDKKGNKFCPACMLEGKTSLVIDDDTCWSCCKCKFKKVKSDCGEAASVSGDFFSCSANIRPKRGFGIADYLRRNL